MDLLILKLGGGIIYTFWKRKYKGEHTTSYSHVLAHSIIAAFGQKYL
jgi:hypothetical protein